MNGLVMILEGNLVQMVGMACVIMIQSYDAGCEGLI